MAKINVRLRVYSRTNTDITLFWNSNELTEDQKENVKVMQDNKPLLIKCDVMGPDTTRGIKEPTISCIISHEDNKLSADVPYTLQVVLGGKNSPAIVRSVSVYPSGILPAYEKDHKPSRVHLMAWDETAQAWTKVPLVKKDGIVGIPVIVVGNYNK